MLKVIDCYKNAINNDVKLLFFCENICYIYIFVRIDSHRPIRSVSIHTYFLTPGPAVFLHLIIIILRLQLFIYFKVNCSLGAALVMFSRNITRSSPNLLKAI